MFELIKNVSKILTILVVAFIFSFATWWLLDPVTFWQTLITLFVSIVVVCLVTTGMYTIVGDKW
jgi:hypothetical protein